MLVGSMWLTKGLKVITKGNWICFIEKLVCYSISTDIILSITDIHEMFGDITETKAYYLVFYNAHFWNCSSNF